MVCTDVSRFPDQRGQGDYVEPAPARASASSAPGQSQEEDVEGVWHNARAYAGCQPRGPAREVLLLLSSDELSSIAYSDVCAQQR